MTLTQEMIIERLKAYQDPYLKQDVISTSMLRDIRLTQKGAQLEVLLGYPCGRIKGRLKQQMNEALADLDGEVDISLDFKIAVQAVQPTLASIENVKNIIAVASGTGGVGNSTTTVNLALALQQDGARVGILDADIYGPNQPHMLGTHAKPESKQEKQLQPVLSHGLQTMSIGYLINPETPMIWRGPMVSSALQQLLRDTQWDDLDYLLIDLPPGTGDIQLTLAQKVPVAGAVIVTTPQDIALLDARKGLEMFNKVKVPVLGIVENMSMHVCTQCGYEEPLFGSRGGEKLADVSGTRLLGQIPLAMSIREAVDKGEPTVVSDPEGTLAETYRDVARNMAAELAVHTIVNPASFPEIEVV